MTGQSQSPSQQANRSKSSSREGWLWGTLLVLGVLGGVVGASQWIASGEADPAPQPMRLDAPGMPLADRMQQTGAPVADDFVPNLPAVPTLPPGARATRA